MNSYKTLIVYTPSKIERLYDIPTSVNYMSLSFTKFTKSTSQ